MKSGDSVRNFKKVCEILESQFEQRPASISAYIAGYKKPYKFYIEHTPKQAAKILIEEAEEKINE